MNALTRNPMAMPPDIAATARLFSKKAVTVARLEVIQPKINMRGNNTRKYAPAAFCDSTLNTAGATTAENIIIKPIFAAWMSSESCNG